MLDWTRLRAVPRYVRQEGWRAAASAAWQAATGLLVRRSEAVLLARDVGPAEAGSAPPRAQDIRVLPPAEDAALVRVAYYGAAEIARRRRTRQQCLVAERNGRIGHYSWLGFGSPYAAEVELVLPLRPTDCYLYNCRTLRSERGRGLFPRVIRFAVEVARQDGAERVVALVSSTNTASLKAFAKAGFTPWLTVSLTRCLAWRRHELREVGDRG